MTKGREDRAELINTECTLGQMDYAMPGAATTRLHDRVNNISFRYVET